MDVGENPVGGIDVVLCDVFPNLVEIRERLGLRVREPLNSELIAWGAALPLQGRALAAAEAALDKSLANMRAEQ